MNASIDDKIRRIAELREEVRRDILLEDPKLWESIRDNEIAKRVIEIAMVSDHTVGFVGNGIAERLVYAAAQAGVTAFSCPPCPCGNYGSTYRTCRCSDEDIRKHFCSDRWLRVNRADMAVETYEVIVPRPAIQELFKHVKERVERARQRGVPEYKEDEGMKSIIKLAVSDIGLSSTALETIRAVTCSIAALDDCNPCVAHLCEAIQYWSRRT